MSVVTSKAAFTENTVWRLTAVLLLGQSIASLAMLAAITVGPIAAIQLWGTTRLAGVPSTMYVIGAALGAFVAGRLMERYGRRFGLALGFLVGALGAGFGAVALVGFVPILLFVSHAVMGLARGALDQGRFAAGEIVTQAQRARVISFVVLGGTVGGIGGALLVKPSGDFSVWRGYDVLAGPYLVGIALCLVGGLVTFLFLRPDPREIGRTLAHAATVVTEQTPPRTFLEALRSIDIQTAIVAMLFGQVVMVTVMVMTPVQMTENLHHTIDAVALVIAAHVTGMYATSVFTGFIADRVGHARTILIGAFLLILACVMAPFADDTVRLATALFILGAGWNFCFVAGSSLLTDSLRPNERARIQGTNDLLVGLVAATGSLGGGFAFELIGYSGIALVGVVMAVGLFAVTLWTVQRKRLAASV